MRPIRRVLVIQPYGIGDLLFITPVLRALRLLPGIERVDLILGSRTEAVVRDNPHVDEVLSLDRDLFVTQDLSGKIREMAALGRKLRARRYDLLLDYSFRDEFGFFGLFFLGIPVRAGYARRRRGIFHNVRLPIPQGFEGRPVAEYAAQLAERAGVPVEDRFLEFYLRPDIRTRAREKVFGKNGGRESYGVLSLGGGESWGKDAFFKRWPPAFFAALTEKLCVEVPFSSLVLVGSQKEFPLGEAFRSDHRRTVYNQCGTLELEETAAIIEGALFFIGNDGGLVHLAHSLRTPVVALYGPADPVVYGPYPASPEAIAVYRGELECRPCYKNFRYKEDCATRECLEALTPETVWESLQSQRFPHILRDRKRILR
ncbi:MAG: glycosyltransferase family 9 protein [Candidatus Omnitrophota bacterium]